MTLGERLRALRTAAGLSRVQLASAAGVKPSAVRDHEQGINLPGVETLAAYSNALGVSSDILLADVTSIRPVPVVVGRPRKSVPFSVPLNGRVAAGKPIESVHTGERLVFSELFGGEGVFALEVRGDSMTGDCIADGDYVLVRGRPEAESGETVVCEIAGESTLKVLKRRGREVWLLPRNAESMPIQVGGRDDMRIVGAMVGVVRRCRG